MLSFLKSGTIPANAWQLIIALARIAVFRNIALAILTAILAVGVTAIVVNKHQAPGGAGPNNTGTPAPGRPRTKTPAGDPAQLRMILPQSIADELALLEAGDAASGKAQPDPDGVTVTEYIGFGMPDPMTYPELYSAHDFKYSCGHGGRYRLADEGRWAWEHPARFLKLAQSYPCAECQSIIQYQDEKRQRQGSKSPGGEEDFGL